MADFISVNAVHVTADRSRVVPVHSEEAAYLLVGPGGRIPAEVADYYGLTNGETVPSAIEERHAGELEAAVGEHLSRLPAKPAAG
jgi:hypothetical protein